MQYIAYTKKESTCSQSTANIMFNNISNFLLTNSLLKIINDYGYNIFKIRYQNASSFFNFKIPQIIAVDPNKLEVLENDYCDMLLTKLSLAELKKI